MLGKGTGVNVSGDDLFGVFQNLTRIVCEDDLDVVPDVPIELQIVNVGKGVPKRAELRAELRFGKGVCIGVYTRLKESLWAVFL